MRFFMNLLWALLGGGLILFVEYLLSGMLLCLTIIGIPFGVQCFKLAFFALAPFGSEAKESSSAGGCLQVLFNIIWILLGGVWIALTHLGLALLCAITLIGIPFAVQHVKMAHLAISPFGKSIERI
ncbi:MAG: YccF domain-containing protein [Deltaproteobacteria bacterium]|nr:YccF domain-containing protein [Deltaproteobacteria bacterium]